MQVKFPRTILINGKNCGMRLSDSEFKKLSSIMKLPEISEDLRKRILSGAILAPLVLLVIYLGGVAYNTMIVVVAVIMSFEWQGIINSGNKELTAQKKRNWNGLGIAY